MGGFVETLCWERYFELRLFVWTCLPVLSSEFHSEATVRNVYLLNREGSGEGALSTWNLALQFYDMEAMPANSRITGTSPVTAYHP
jgi:hypothetical protein